MLAGFAWTLRLGIPQVVRTAPGIPDLHLAWFPWSPPGTARARTGPPSDSVPPWLEPYRGTADRLASEAMTDTTAWSRLSALTDEIGPRFSGTPQLDRAIEWAVAEMQRDGLE